MVFLFLKNKYPVRIIQGGKMKRVKRYPLLQEAVDRNLFKCWQAVPLHIKDILRHPELYTGDAKKIALREAKNKL